MEEKELLTEITIDNFSFHVTANPGEYGSCILWQRDINTEQPYSLLGKFARFNKQCIIDFMVKYAHSKRLQIELQDRIFELKLSSISLDFFRTIKYKSKDAQHELFKMLFDLDHTMEKEQLTKRRRMMAKRFHPDAGGNNSAMKIINEAYDFLLCNT